MTEYETPTSRPRTGRSTKLSYTPQLFAAFINDQLSSLVRFNVTAMANFSGKSAATTDRYLKLRKDAAYPVALPCE